ncbi:hypothetical protein ECE50_005675 [Chitinophaga sp. Mgbs1]|uniref:Uncharacterized protein n=1 Tax=Chitinophaga solisilvae TaxID=1233460 RepID=A0A9Q5D776_9BACT|nr:hypothetical protein [Chitinophaga solisilvae]
MLRMLLTMLLAAAISQGYTQQTVFRGKVVFQDDVIKAGSIVFPLTKKTLEVPETGLVNIDLREPGQRIFFFSDIMGRNSRMLRFLEGIAPDTLTVILAADKDFYAPFIRGRRCPVCLSEKNVVPIVYGFPGRQSFADARAGRILLGGCIMSPEKLYCKKDEFSF